MENNIQNLEGEIWKPINILEYESYLISNYGRFYQKEHTELNRWGTQTTKPGREIKEHLPGTIYLKKYTGKCTRKGYKVDELLMNHYSIEEIKYNINPIIDLPGELWKTIEDYPDYQASNKGRIKALSKVRAVRYGTRITREKLIIQHYNKILGYNYVGLHQKDKPSSRSVHRLIALTWVLNPENKREVNHIDGDKLNNNVDNLEWTTPLENTRHAFYTGHKSKRLILSIDKAKEIRELKTMGLHNSQIALVMQVPIKGVRRVVKNESWTF